MKSTELKTGQAVNFDGKLYVVIKTEHTKPGKGPAYIQAKMKEVGGSGSTIEKRLGSSDNIDAINLDRREAEYLYQDGDGYVFMDSETFDQFTLQQDFVGDSMVYVRPNSSITVLFNGETPVVVELPAAVELEVAECQPGIKGATVTNQLKEAVMETGLKTRVPPFIEQGEMVKISTADGSYMSRVKGD